MVCVGCLCLRTPSRAPYNCGWGSRKARGDADSVPRAPLDPPLWTVVPNSNKALSLALAGPTKTQRMALLRCLRGLRQLFQASASGLRQFFRERRFRLLMRTRLVLSAAFLRGNGVIRRTQKVIQGMTTATSGVLARFPLLLPVRNSFARHRVCIRFRGGCNFKNRGSGRGALGARMCVLTAT